MLAPSRENSGLRTQPEASALPSSKCASSRFGWPTLRCHSSGRMPLLLSTAFHAGSSSCTPDPGSARPNSSAIRSSSGYSLNSVPITVSSSAVKRPSSDRPMSSMAMACPCRPVCEAQSRR
ncbi:hypothetical protein D3C72_1589020 [compost metagenome]